MMTVLSVAVFATAFAIAIGVIAFSIAPQWRRIVRLALGQVEHPFAPLSALAYAERRIAVRRWSTQSASSVRLRAAA